MKRSFLRRMPSVKSGIFRFVALISLVVLSGCYKPASKTPDAWDLTKQQQDSISFRTTHHYAQNYNFVVRTDSLQLSCRQPDEIPFDFVTLYDDDHIVVAGFMMMSEDTVDSVWVKVARDQNTQGWIRECELLQAVSPDDPISWFIDLFDDIDILLSLALIVVFAAAYSFRVLMRRKSYIVHFNDIPSFYPTLLCILVATSATLYASIQLFDPESWRHFYYHPTLNPFKLPLHLGIFISTIWLIIVVGITAIEDVRHILPRSEAVLYLCSLGAMCAVDYIVFGITTLYYIGYPLLAAYVYCVLRRYIQLCHGRYICGRCGRRIPDKGTCPNCGAINK